MENKLQQLTQKLYDEGLEKGRAEADRMVADAKTRAAKIVADAEAQAGEIVRKAQAKAEDVEKRWPASRPWPASSRRSLR